MSTSFASQSAGIDQAYDEIVQLWILRALLRRNGAADFVRVHGFSDASVARFLGYPKRDPDGYSPAWAEASLEVKLAALEENPPTLPRDTTLSANVQLLGERLGLNVVEQDILSFKTLQHLHGEFSDALDTVGDLSYATLCRLLCTCLNHPLAAVQAALDDRAKLCRSALLKVDRKRNYAFRNKVDMLDGMAEQFMLEHQDLLDLFNHCIAPARPPRLTLEDFPHVAEDVGILKAYLDAATRLQQPGVNVLIHGRPGTGKTEFARALGVFIGAKAMEIPVEEPTGQPRAGKTRFEAYRLAQTLLGGADERHLLIFDEVEDVFNEAQESGKAFDGNSSGIKGWVNQLLERNPISTIWITNHLGAMDPAYRRRFDYVLHLDVPPASVRRRLIDQHTRGLDLGEGWREGAARHPDMVPAIVERASKVGVMVCDVLPEMEAERVLTRVMNNTLEALGVLRLPEEAQGQWLTYSLDLLNADCDLQQLRDGMQRVGEGRLCLYGPPGTGKSAYGKYVAEALDRPLLVRRASDILSPYVGVAEKQIARMFREATREGAVLLLDEADSLLQDRRGAQRSWEVTQVNEMLTQMEDFRGIFIASTNMMDSLDAAALRRFDASVRFGYLDPEQAVRMFAQLLQSLGLADEGEWRSGIARLDTLTPGDFASVWRGCRLNSPDSSVSALRRLTQISALKQGMPKAPMGFMF